jgi:hypothetical protein
VNDTVDGQLGMDLEVIKGAASASGVGICGTVAGAPWWGLGLLVLAILALDYGWRVFQRPDLARRWIDLAEHRRAHRRRGGRT